MTNKSKGYVLVLIIWSLGPLLWQLYTSFSSVEALINPLENNIKRWTLDNYIQVLTANPPFWKYLANSTIVATISTLLTLIIAIPGAYALTKLQKEIKTFARYMLIGASLFPYVILFLALLEIAREFNLGNNLIALSIPYSALEMPLALLLLSSAFNDIPAELEEAARLEGLGIWQRLRFILIPLIAPSTASTGILVFLFAWNEYPIALTWISKTEILTLPVAIARIAGSSVYSVPYGAYAAATVLGALPLLAIVFIFQKQIVSGLTQGAIKG